MLLGNQTPEAYHDTSSGNASEAFGFTATSSGTATTANVYLDSTDGATAGLYSSSSRRPGTLLDKGSVSSNTAGWTTIALKGGVQVTSGVRYWIAVGSTGASGATVTYRDLNNAGTNLDFSGTGFSSPYQTNGRWQSNPISAYIGGGQVVLPPSNTSVPTISGTAQVGDTLTASTGGWTASQPITYSYLWSDGTTGSTDKLPAADVGKMITVKVTATDSAGSASATSVGMGPVTSGSTPPIAPANSGLPTISGVDQEAQMLTATNGTWTGTAPITYAYQWQDCDGSGNSCSNISGATSSSNMLTSGDLTHTLRAVVKATNAGGSSSAASAATAVITGGGSGTYTCTQHVTTSSFASAFSSAPGGDVLCLAPGNYGAFSGGAKSSPGVVITADTSAGGTQNNVIFGQVTYSSSSWVTLDNVTVGGVSISGSPTKLVISSDFFKGFVDIEGLQSTDSTNVLFDHDQFTWANSTTCSGSSQPGLFFLGYSGNGLSGVTVQNSTFANGDCDGVHTGTALDVLNNTFYNLCDVNTNHTDNIQFQGAVGGRIARNYVHEPLNCTTQGITSYDGGTNGVTIENNVVDTSRTWGIEFYADVNSIIRHNTVVYRSSGCNAGACGYIDINCKTGAGCPSSQGHGTQVYDNIATVSVEGGATAARNDHNHNGADVSYAGGSPPSNGFGAFSDYLLAPGSAGKAAADDGTDLGITGSG